MGWVSFIFVFLSKVLVVQKSLESGCRFGRGFHRQCSLDEFIMTYSAQYVNDAKQKTLVHWLSFPTVASAHAMWLWNIFILTILCFAYILQSSSTYVNGATSARFLHFQTSILSMDEIVKYNRIIKKIEKCGEGEGRQEKVHAYVF